MRRLIRFVVTVLAAVGIVLVAANTVHAQEVNAPTAARGTAAVAYDVVGQPLLGARVESVLTDPHGAVAGTKRGTGWLLHYGTERDTCTRPDATSRLRMMCVGW